MSQIKGWLTILVGIIILLPLAGVTQLGTITGDIMQGALAWLFAIIVIVVGILKVMNKKK
ncbi:MAG: hypothetical protein AABW67_02965 [Nanoarchaeota archaeon]